MAVSKVTAPVRAADTNPTQLSSLVDVARQHTMEYSTMRHFLLSVMVVALIALGGCAGMSETQQRTLTGGAGGAAGGALIGAMAGNAGMGAAIGAGAGLLGGFLYGEHEESKKAAYQKGLQDGSKKAQQ
jgi:osmotically inducible lipoprotein OsmB